MRALAAICIKRPVFAAMIILALVVVGAASFFRLGVDRFPAVDLPNVMVRTTLPGASVEEVESTDLRRPRRSRQSRRGHQRAALGLRSAASRCSTSRSISIATSTPRRRTCAIASRRRSAACPTTSNAPMIVKQDSDNSPTSVDRALRQPLDPRAHRDRRQDRQGPARAIARRRRSADRRRARARDQHLGGRRSAGRLSAADHRSPRRAAAAERRPARRQRHHRHQRAHAAHDGPLHSTPISSTIWSSPRATARRFACATSAAPKTAPKSSVRSRG